MSTTGATGNGRSITGAVSQGTGGVVAYPPVDDGAERRTLLVGTRLFLAANTMLMGALLFGYVYLRTNNWNGMWRPSGIDDLASIPMAIILLLQLACLVAVVMGAAAAARGRSIRALAGLGLLLGLAAGAVRVWYQYNLGSGWVINNGTYTAMSEMWFGILIVEILMGCVWMLAIVASGDRSTTPAVSERHLRAFSEFWAYMLAVATLVWLLVRLV